MRCQVFSLLCTQQYSKRCVGQFITREDFLCKRDILEEIYARKRKMGIWSAEAIQAAMQSKVKLRRGELRVGVGLLGALSLSGRQSVVL